MDIAARLYSSERENASDQLRRALNAARQQLDDASRALENGKVDSHALHQLAVDAAEAVRHGGTLTGLNHAQFLVKNFADEETR